MQPSALAKDTTVYFCQLQKQPLEVALTQLLLKCLQRGLRANVCCPNAERLNFIDSKLWDVPHEWILPHGLGNMPYPERQPIWLSQTIERPNQAEVVFLCEGAWLGEWTPEPDIQRYCLMLETDQPFNYTESARILWKDCPQEQRQHLKL